jgi:hypothetical protein
MGSTNGYDGVTLLSTAHPKLDGTVSNRPNPYVDLGAASLEDAIVALKKQVSFEGIPSLGKRQVITVPSCTRSYGS